MSHKRREYVYFVYDYDTYRVIGSYASFTRDTSAKMRDYLVRHGDIPQDAYVRTDKEAAL